MDIAFDSVAFAVFLAAHLLAAVALTARAPRFDGGTYTPNDTCALTILQPSAVRIQV
jgi:hypothetical protein